MKIQLLPSTFDAEGRASLRQHLTTLIVDDKVAFDAGSLAQACSQRQRDSVRDIVLTHAHLDHTAGLPLFIDDLFSVLTEPVRVHASREVIRVLEENIFNWSVYPKFSELSNGNGPVMEYVPFDPGQAFSVGHLQVMPVEVNHKVPSCGFIISDGASAIAMTGDTAPTEEFWSMVNGLPSLSALLIECAFPDRLAPLAASSHHLTPSGLSQELAKLDRVDCGIFVVNIKPSHRDEIVVDAVAVDPRIGILEVGREYEW